ncbi:Octapeptide-repeat protein T2, partial [Ophiophagus hannah]
MASWSCDWVGDVTHHTQPHLPATRLKGRGRLQMAAFGPENGPKNDLKKGRGRASQWWDLPVCRTAPNLNNWCGAHWVKKNQQPREGGLSHLSACCWAASWASFEGGNCTKRSPARLMSVSTTTCLRYSVSVPRTSGARWSTICKGKPQKEELSSAHWQGRCFPPSRFIEGGGENCIPPRSVRSGVSYKRRGKEGRGRKNNGEQEEGKEEGRKQEKGKGGKKGREEGRKQEKEGGRTREGVKGRKETGKREGGKKGRKNREKEGKGRMEGWWRGLKGKGREILRKAGRKERKIGKIVEHPDQLELACLRRGKEGKGGKRDRKKERGKRRKEGEKVEGRKGRKGGNRKKGREDERERKEGNGKEGGRKWKEGGKGGKTGKREEGKGRMERWWRGLKGKRDLEKREKEEKEGGREAPKAGISNLGHFKPGGLQLPEFRELKSAKLAGEFWELGVRKGSWLAPLGSQSNIGPTSDGLPSPPAVPLCARPTPRSLRTPTTAAKKKSYNRTTCLKSDRTCPNQVISQLRAKMVPTSALLGWGAREGKKKGKNVSNRRHSCSGTNPLPSREAQMEDSQLLPTPNLKQNGAGRDLGAGDNRPVMANLFVVVCPKCVCA